MLNFQDSPAERSYTASLVKQAIPLLKKRQQETKDPVYLKLIQACENIGEPEYIASGRNSDVYAIGNDFVIKRNGSNNYKIPESRFVLQPLLQCKIDEQDIEIYDRMIQPSKKEVQVAKWFLIHALRRDGLDVDDKNDGYAMINPRTGIMQVVDNEDCKRIEDVETARIKYDNSLKEDTPSSFFPLPKRPSAEEILKALSFPNAIKQEAPNSLSIITNKKNGRL